MRLINLFFITTLSLISTLASATGDWHVYTEYVGPEFKDGKLTDAYHITYFKPTGGPNQAGPNWEDFLVHAPGQVSVRYVLKADSKCYCDVNFENHQLKPGKGWWSGPACLVKKTDSGKSVLKTILAKECK